MKSARRVRRAWFGAGLLAALIGLASPALAQAPARIPSADLADVMTVYVDGIVELRQFFMACAKDPENWDSEADMLIASLKAAGLDNGTADTLRGRMNAGKEGAAAYDCGGEVTRQRLANPPLSDWSAYHEVMLRGVGIEPVRPIPQDDPRLVALRKLFAEYTTEQTASFKCVSIIEPQSFPQTFADWNAVLDQAQASILAAGFDAQTTDALVGPARGARLLQPVKDRQAEIAACMNDNRWMTWHFTMRWYAIASEVEKVLGTAQ